MNKNLHLYSEKQKYENDQQWFKDFMTSIDRRSGLTNENFVSSTKDEYHNMKINYDLYNGIIDKEDFMEYCQMGGFEFEFPENFVNEDIISTKIKVLEGLELARPFYFKVLAVNPEATTRKEEEYFSRYSKFVIETIMQEIQAKITEQEMAQFKGKQPSQEEMTKIQQDIAQKTEQSTPDEVKRYMERNHQDPAEVLASQLLNYMMYNLNIKNVFNAGWSDVVKVSREIYRIYTISGEPKLERINPMIFDFDRNTPTGKIQDGEWSICIYNYSMIDIAKQFPDLNDSELLKLSDEYYDISANNFSFGDYQKSTSYLIAKHYTWKSLRKIGFLTYIDMESKTLQEKIVDETYKLNPQYGDIELTWSRIHEVYEGWKLGTDTYTAMQRVSYIRDLDDINNVKLPYFGTIYDNDNSVPTSLIDRLKTYQYLYDIIIIKLRTLMASDKGKLLLMNIGIIPRSQNIDMKKWLEYASMMNIGFYNPHEEGNTIVDINSAAKVLDLSLSSDIQKYIELASYIENKAGESVGITKQIVGRIGANEAVGNTRQSIVQSSYVLEPYFNMHNIVKRDTLEYLLNIARLAYTGKPKKKLSFALDDLSSKILELDRDLLLFNTFGIFISNSMKPDELKENIVALSQAALQNQRADYSDIIKILKTDNLEEADEILTVAEKEASRKMEQLQQSQMQSQQQMLKDANDHELDLINLKGKWAIEELKVKGQLELTKQTLQLDNNDKNRDIDRDGVPDILEVEKEKMNNENNLKKQALEEAKFKHQKYLDEEKLKLERKKIDKAGSK